MKYLLLPDSYKGCLSAPEVAEAMALGISDVCPSAEAVKLPVSDGGEGFTMCAFSSLGGKMLSLSVTGPLGDPIEAPYLLSGDTAIMECASACGLTLVAPERRDPMKATTFGLGEMIKDALSRGARRIIIGLGGSGTNDGGLGLLAALGVSLQDKSGEDVPPGAVGLLALDYADFSGLCDFSGVEIIAACDVTNPLCGPDGATFVYGPQKGVAPELLPVIDSAMMNYACVCGIDPFFPGGGAAGGLGAAIVGVLGGKFRSGIELMLELQGVEALLSVGDVAAVFTGEGHTDSQSLYGKAVSGVAALAKKHGVQAVLISGAVDDGIAPELRDAGVTGVYPLSGGNTGVTAEESIKNAPALIRERTRESLANGRLHGCFGESLDI